MAGCHFGSPLKSRTSFHTLSADASMIALRYTLIIFLLPCLQTQPNAEDAEDAEKDKRNIKRSGATIPGTFDRSGPTHFRICPFFSSANSAFSARLRWV